MKAGASNPGSGLPDTDPIVYRIRDAERIRILVARVAFGIPFLLVLAATWKLTLGNRIIARGDLLLYFYPLRDYASAAVRSGIFPLWNPYTFMGSPFLANSQAGFFYPLNLLEAWFPVAHAVSWSIAAHLLIAAAGMYVLARYGLRLGLPAALACSVAFGLGGYLGAQVEHLNQLQVLAWLPWEVAVISRLRPELRAVISRLLLLALLIALQVAAGHTQSLYICMVTLGIAAVTSGMSAVIQYRRRRVRMAQRDRFAGFRPLIALSLLITIAGVAAAAMTAAQLLPTLELAAHSARSGGLPFNEVGSFSWRPWVIARSLLPTYGDPLFPEYVAYLGVTGLALAVLGAIAPSTAGTGAQDVTTSENPNWRTLALVLAVCGAVLALGIATPLFAVLYRFMPGFNLFRAQARWLIVFAFGSALLIGLGIEALANRLTRQTGRCWLLAWFAVSLLLIAALLLGARYSPEAVYRSLPNAAVLAGWAIGYTVVTAWIVLVTMKAATLQPQRDGIFAGIFTALLCIELLAASQYQPYARASDGQALTDLRPATAFLLADKALRGAPSSSSERVLALSGLFFDPGDMPEQTLIYQNQLSRDELYDRIIASKEKEVLSPNLSLYYRLYGVDGYDGGLLPLRRYEQFVAPLASAAGHPPLTDGRLRESLTAVPPDPWLSRMAVRYVITDKTHDVFINNVYYDMQFSQAITGTLSLPLNAFDSTSLGLVLSAPLSHPGDKLLNATVSYTDGASQDFTVRAGATVTQPYFGATLRWNAARVPAEITLRPLASDVNLRSMSSIDNATGAFLSQPIRWSHNMLLAHSGDVKVYENLNPAPRIAIVSGEDVSIHNGGLRVAETAARHSAGAGIVSLTVDAPEQLTMSAAVSTTGWLIVRDAYYPGWTAHVDGKPVPILPADTMFRAIAITPGKHRIEFRYEPQSFTAGLIVSAAGIAAWSGAWAVLMRPRLRLKRKRNHA